MIFNPFNIGKVTIKNRFVKSATPDFPGEPDGCCSESYIEYLTKFANGGIGLVCTSPVSIQLDIRVNRYQLSISDDRTADSCRPLIEEIHGHGAKIFIFLDYSHKMVGKFMLSALEPDESKIKDAFEDTKMWITSGLTEQKIIEIINSYKKAIIRAKQAGFDGIFLNGILGAFLQDMGSRRFNQRKDEWGGDLTGRLKIVEEIIYLCKAIDIPVFVRWDVKGYEQDGVVLEESIEACKLIEGYGADALELSAFCSIESTIALNRDIKNRNLLPLTESNDLVDYYRIMHIFTENRWFLERKEDIKLPLEYVWGHAYYNIQPVKKLLKIPVSILGGIRALRTAEKIISHGCSDFISLARALIYDPEQCRHFQEGSSLYSSCISCNSCMIEMFNSLKDSSRPYLHHCVISGK